MLWYTACYQRRRLKSAHTVGYFSLSLSLFLTCSCYVESSVCRIKADLEVMLDSAKEEFSDVQ